MGSETTINKSFRNVLLSEDSMDDQNKAFKIVVVGDGSVGKTCLCTVYAKNEFPTEYVPTIFETFTMTMVLSDNKELKVNIWDTAVKRNLNIFGHLTIPKPTCSLFVSVSSIGVRLTMLRACGSKTRKRWHQEFLNSWWEP